MYETFYAILFYLNIVLLLAILGMMVVSTWVSVKSLHKTRWKSLRKQTAFASLLTGGGLCYLFTGAFFSLLATSRHDDPTVFYLPVGFVLLLAGILLTFKINKDSGK